MKNKSRTRFKRRDRRRAKQTGWRREPKKSGIVGHGTAMRKTTTLTVQRGARKEDAPTELRERPRLTFRIKVDGNAR